MVIDIRTTFGE